MMATTTTTGTTILSCCTALLLCCCMLTLSPKNNQVITLAQAASPTANHQHHQYHNSPSYPNPLSSSPGGGGPSTHQAPHAPQIANPCPNIASPYSGCICKGPNNYVCPPVVINNKTELVVGPGSNVSFSCSVRGTPPMTFVWFQDERNLTTPGGNGGGQDMMPASTKLLDDRRFEINERYDEESGSGPSINTSILYLYNLQLSDTSLFLCWVENAANYTLANFTLIVNRDAPVIGFGQEGSSLSPNAGLTSGGFFRFSQGETQVGIVAIAFIIILIAATVLVLIYRQTNRSSKSSQSSIDKKKGGRPTIGNPQPISTISSSNKFNVNQHNNHSMLADSEDDDVGNDSGDDNQSSSQESSSSSCRKSAKLMASGELEGFIEHMRSGIINMDYHSMSPAIQFNTNTLKKQQQTKLHQQQPHQQQMPYLNTIDHHQMHHFQSSSNASSLPYYNGGNGNGSISMATTTSDLSPASSGVGSNITNLMVQPQPTTANVNHLNPNCDYQQQQLHHHHHHHHHLTPAINTIDNSPMLTNATTTSYTSSGYGSEDHHHQQQLVAAATSANLIPQHSQVFYTGVQEPILSQHASMFDGHQQLISADPLTVTTAKMLSPPTIRYPQQQQQKQADHQQHQQLVMQDMMHSANQRHHLDPGLHIL